MSTTNNAQGGARDFAFLAGQWQIDNRRLVRRLAGCDEWEEFQATLSERPALGGLGSVGELRARIGGREVIGLLVRIFHPATGRWSQHWVENTRLEFDPPLLGSFADGRGLFEGEEMFEGKKVRVRCIWSVRSPDSVTWEQAYSPDDGATWETNWRMLLTRVAR